ncbi:MAG: hypothetical protein JXA00_00645 [Candidatus Thermoplasmatota archaeon]|nr:hypothetical protein [Candidatus Thermoplasmatota archaeon]
MKDVWILAGVILLCVLILGAWLFIGEMGGFSLFLGEKSEEATSDEFLRFVGSWYNEEYGSITFFGTKTYRRGAEEGTWRVQNTTLSLYTLDGASLVAAYQYHFVDQDASLQLSTAGSIDIVTLTRQS